MTQLILQIITLILTGGGMLAGTEILRYKAAHRASFLSPTAWFGCGSNASPQGLFRALMLGGCVGACLSLLIAAIVLTA